MKRVALIGAGVMGTAIATRLLEEGFQVTAFDLDKDKLRHLEAIGAVSATSASQATSQSDYVITSLNSAGIVEKAVFSSSGIAEAADDKKLLIDMSSIDAGKTKEFADRLLAATGMGWVDAPLSGGAPAALKGELTLMLGGRNEDVKRAEEVLIALSKNRTHFGQAGSGQTVKLINQILCACHFFAVAEAVKFAEAFDVDPALIPAALAGGRADSRIMQEFMAKMGSRDYSPTGRIDNMLKDLETAQAGAFSKRIPLPLTSLITDFHRMFVAGGKGSADSAEYMRLFDLSSEK